jgi:L-iditol 2-dehydrogenase
MKAAYLTGVRSFEIRDLPTPEIDDPDQVLLRIDRVGVCGSDLHYYTTGKISGRALDFPLSMGHECTATVMGVGSRVDRIEVGQRVAVEPLICCERCDQCLAGRFNTCRSQFFLGYPGQAPGALREYLVLPARNCFPLPEGMSMDEAVLAEPLSIGLHAVRLAGQAAGKKAAMLGSGPIGLSVLLALREKGVEETFATDLLPERLALARRLGAGWTGNPNEEDVIEAVLSQEKAGIDLVFECAGEQETLDQGIELLKPGGTLVIVGIPESDWIRFSPDQLRRKELRLQNVRRQNECMQDAIDLIASGRVEVALLATHHFKLEQTKEAYDLAADYRDGVVKAMIDVP